MATGRILTYAQYAALRHPTPYPVEINDGPVRLLVLGGRHSSDPSEPLFEAIDESFRALSPRIALHEGSPPAVEPDREVAIRRHGEAGLVCHLAARTGVPAHSMDIPLVEEARVLRRSLGTPTALVFLVVRQLASFNRKTARMDFDGYFGDFFALIAPGLELESIDWPLVEREHRRFLGCELQRAAIDGTQTDPMRSELPTQRIARASNRLRDLHMLRVLVSAARRWERVFASVGVTHAVMLEPALRARLASPP